jgi:hypothetical protein
MTTRLRGGTLATLVGSVVAGLVAFACGSFSPSDPGASDAGAVPDAGTDGTGGSGIEPERDACAGPRYCDCQVGVAFCADFDGPSVVSEWDQNVVTGAGTVAATPSERSAPNALHTTMAAVSSADERGSARVSKRLQGDVASLSLAFDVGAIGLCAMNGDAVHYVEIIAYDVAGKRLENVSLLATKSGLKLFAKGAATEYTDLVPLPNTREWTRVAIVQKGGMLSITYDGQPAGGPVPFSFTSASFDVTFGIAMNGPSAFTACEVEYDNVVLRK